MAKTSKPKVEGGSVTFSMGLTVPGGTAYSSIRVDAGMTLPIQPGETPDAAADRVCSEVMDAFNLRAQPAASKLNDALTGFSNKSKTPGR